MILWMISALAAYFVKGLCGFANTLVFTSILSFGENNTAITPVDLLLSCPANAVMAWKHRRDADWHVWLPVSLLLFAGAIPGTFFLKNLDARLVKIIFGCAILLIGIDLLLPLKPRKESRIVMILLAVVSGVLCGLYGVGALLAAYFSKTAKNSSAFKGSLSMVFFLENLFRLILYIISGVFTLPVLIKSAELIPFMALGLFLGIQCAGRIKETTAKRIVVILLLISGAALILTNL